MKKQVDPQLSKMAKLLVKKSLEVRFGGKTKEEKSEIMRKLALKRWAKK